MKTKITALFVLVVLLFSLCSCAEFFVDTSDVKVTYESNNGDPAVVLGVGLVGLERPKTPVREGYIFTGWYKDVQCSKLYDFEKVPTHNITLYAGWRFDAVKAINKFSQTLMSSSVCVSCTFYNSNIFGEMINHKTVSGSGVIIYEDSEKYYILSNNHVVNNTTGFMNESYEVIDAYGRVHRAEVLYRDAAYDLSLLSISKGLKKLSVAPLATATSEINTPVLAVGSPDGQLNTVTVGAVVDFTKVEIDDISAEDNAIDFPVLFHDAPIDNGSSGGALFDGTLSLIGINFAATERDDSFKYGLAVGADKIREFLQNTSLRSYFSL